MPLVIQSQMRIKINIENQDDNIYYLLKYKSDKTQIVIDSTDLHNGKMIIENNSNIDEGIYIIADSHKNALFEILIGKDQKFSIDIKELMDYNSYEIKGSKETSSYFDIYAKTIYNNLYIKALNSEIEYNPNNIYKIDSLKTKLYEYQESMLLKDKDSFLNTYIKFIEKVQVPKDYNNDYEYITEHYFDELPLCDHRILNSRLLKNKLDDYFNNYASKSTSDFICDKIDLIISKVSDCKDVRDYILWNLYSRFFKPENIYHELVFVHLVDNYFSHLEIDNLTDDIRTEIIRRAEILRNIAIGQAAPPISYVNENNETIDLYDIKSKYTVLFFYKPDCQRCMRDKRVLNMVKKRRKDLEILHIDISEENNKISQDIINQYDIMTTPTIYLLNDKKDIIAKQIKAEEIEFHIIKR